MIETDTPIPARAGDAGHVRLQCGSRVRHHLGIDLRIDGEIHRVLPDCELQPGEPQRFELSEAKKCALCTCKRTANMPFCDGAHNKL